MGKQWGFLVAVYNADVHGLKSQKKRDASVKHTLGSCGTCYRKSEGTELCGIEIEHSSL